MAVNNNTRKLARVRLAYSNRSPKAMHDIAIIAREFFRAGFKNEGSDVAGFKKWKDRKIHFSGKGRSLLRQSGNLFNSIKSRSGKKTAVVFSNTKYGALHNDGGTVTVTRQMRRFFWAKHMEAKEAGKMEDAEIWKAMAFKKGNTITIPARPFIYESRTLDKKIQRYIDKFITSL